ncbi:MAG TPA: sigma-54 dependent transcriptional regulator [Candidatus Dormibacteraeota bacterium]|nr:sigma-54 dependent transcriptional regulator [Candidatus Dormibacteraeota bacterium]
MLHQLLVIEGLGVERQNSAGDYLTLQDGFDCRRVEWDPRSPQQPSCAGVELVLLAAPAQMEDPLRFFAWLQDHPLRTSSVAILPTNPDTKLLQAASEMVNDFVISPVKSEELRFRVLRILGMSQGDEHSIRQRLKQEMGLAGLVGQDPGFLKVLESIPGIAASNAPVLLLGETGTGKELCAQAIHNLSSRQNGPFIPVECGAIPEHLAENELFGHTRGAFTDAHRDQKGVAAMAEGGTLFLDEIDSLPPAAQAKLLRFIQEGVYRPLGSQRFERSDLRLIAATNCDLEVCIQKESFRRDLYFRLNVLRLRLPPLRERRQDIVLLAQHFLDLHSASRKPAKQFSEAALQGLQNYPWPGNVRELQNTIQRAVAFSAGPTILPEHLDLPVGDGATPADNFRRAKSRVVEHFERAYLEELLRKHAGNVTQAARDAGKDRRVFGRMMKKYDIRRNAS